MDRSDESSRTTPTTRATAIRSRRTPSGGAGLVSGRIVGLAVGGGYLSTSAAPNGGVFRSADDGQTWTPMTDGLPTLSVGDLRLAPDGALWLATGEANTGATAYVGTGVYRLANPATGVVHGGRSRRRHRAREHVHRQAALRRHRQRVCGDLARRVEALGVDEGRRVAARAVSRCRIRSSTACRVPTCSRRTTTSATTSRSSRAAAASTCSPTARGATARRTTASTTRPMAAQTFARVNPNGALNPQDVGRTTFAYASDGSRALRARRVDDEVHQLESDRARRRVRLADAAIPPGPWNKIAGVRQAGIDGLGAQERGLLPARASRPGTTSSSTSIPPTPNHVFVGLEEVYETEDGGVALDDDRPVLELRLPLLVGLRQRRTPARRRRIPISIRSPSTAARVYVGNDGGLYRAAAARHRQRQRQRDRLAEPEREPAHAAVLLGGASARCLAASRCRAACRTTADRCCCPRISPAPARWARRSAATAATRSSIPNDGCQHPPGVRLPGDGADRELRPIRRHGRDRCATSIRTIRSRASSRRSRPTPSSPITGSPAASTSGRTRRGSRFSRAPTGRRSSTTAPDTRPRSLASQNDVVWTRVVRPVQHRSASPAASRRTRAAPGISSRCRRTFPNRYISGLAIDPADATRRARSTSGSTASRACGSKGPARDSATCGRRPTAARRGPTSAATCLTCRSTTCCSSSGTHLSGDRSRRRHLQPMAARRGRGSASNLPYTTAMDIHRGPDARIYAATHGRGIWSIAEVN